MTFPERMKTSMNLTGQFCAGCIGTVATTAACLALLCWSFGCALWSVVVMGEQAEDLL
jgi:hypothetical protein